jgi:hypothetical protein
MPDLPISGLPAASTPLSGDELIVVVQTDVTCQTTLGSITLTSYSWSEAQIFTGNGANVVIGGPDAALTVPNGVLLFSYSFSIGILPGNLYFEAISPSGGVFIISDSSGVVPVLALISSEITGNAALNAQDFSRYYAATLCTLGGPAGSFHDSTNNVAICDGANALTVTGNVTGTWAGDPIPETLGGTGGTEGVQVPVYHNGMLVGSFPGMNFVDSATITFTVVLNAGTGNVDVTAATTGP